MPRGHEPDDFIGPHEVPDRCSRTSEPDQTQQERTPSASFQTDRKAVRSLETRKIYEIRGRTYRLRSSEIATMVEVGKFRTIGVEDLWEFLYHETPNCLRPDAENLIRQGLIQMKAVPHEEKGSRHLLSLTKLGLGFLTEQGFAPRGQSLHCGFVTPGETHHDADLYRLYQRASEKIRQSGGRSLRVVLEYELKKRVYQDFAELGSERNSLESKQTVADRHGLRVVGVKIPLPDLRVEYDTPDGERARVDIELATRNYRGRTLADKVRAGFSLYARVDDVSHLRRVLDQRELTAEIFSL